MMVERIPSTPFPTPPDLELPPNGDQEGGGSFDLKERVVYGIWRSRWLVLVLLGIGGAIGLIVAAASPNMYSSMARLRLRSGRIETFSMEEILGVEIERPTFFSTTDEVFLLEDPEIYLKVADEIGVHDIMVPPDPTRHDTDETPAHIAVLHKIQKVLYGALNQPHCTDATCMQCRQRAAEILKARTDLVPERGSSVISVHHNAFSPELAQRTAQALVVASVERHKKEFAVAQFVGPSKLKLDEVSKALEKSKSDYETHRKGCEIVDIDVQTEATVQAMHATDTDLLKSQAELEGVSAKLAVQKKQLKETLPTVTRIIPGELAANPEYTMWLERVYALRLQRYGIRSQPGQTISWYENEEKRLDELIEDAEVNRSALEDQKTLVSVPEQQIQDRNVVFQELETLVHGSEAEEQRLRALITKQEGSITKYKEDLERLVTCEKIHDRFVMEIDGLEKTFLKLSEKNAELEALSPLDVQSEANLRELQKATLPMDKDGPQRSKLVLMGLFGGFAIGVGIALAVQFLDRRLRYPSTVERQLRLPLLGVVPEVRSLHGLIRRRRVA